MSATAAPPGARPSHALSAALVAGLAAFGMQAFWVRRFFVSIPFWDEWDDLFGFLATYRAGLLDWHGLFAQHMEHRIPVGRLFFLLVYTIFGEGSLLGCVLTSALLMGAIAAVWVYTIRRLGEPRGAGLDFAVREHALGIPDRVLHARGRDRGGGVLDRAR